MFYVLEQKLEDVDGSRYLNQVGIVVADSIHEAAAKIGARVVDAVYPPESAVECAELERGYWLTEIEEVQFLPEPYKP